MRLPAAAVLSSLIHFPVKIWLFNTPQVNAVTVFLSSPVALAVSLWGMTSSKIQHALTFPASDRCVA
jgi:hypothetical protein